MPRSAASDLGLHCLPRSQKRNIRLIWVQGFNKHTYTLLKKISCSIVSWVLRLKQKCTEKRGKYHENHTLSRHFQQVSSTEHSTKSLTTPSIMEPSFSCPAPPVCAHSFLVCASPQPWLPASEIWVVWLSAWVPWQPHVSGTLVYPPGRQGRQPGTESWTGFGSGWKT